MKQKNFLSMLKEIRNNVREWTEEEFEERMKLGFTSFRKYLPNENWSGMKTCDMKIQITERDVDMKKKQNALSKARSVLKKSEHVKTPKSIKDKLKTKEKKA